MIYRWKEGTRVKNLKATVAAKRINQIRSKLRRDVRPQDILSDAADPKSPLHDAFDWDDSSAAHKWRLHQAGSIIVGIEVVEKDGDGNDAYSPVRAFVRVHRENEKPGYMPIAEAMRDNVTRHQVLRIAKMEAKAWASRYRKYEEFSRVVEVIDTVTT